MKILKYYINDADSVQAGHATAELKKVTFLISRINKFFFFFSEPDKFLELNSVTSLKLL